MMFHVKRTSAHTKIDYVRLAALLEAAGCAVNSTSLRLLGDHLQLVLEANTRMNLTRITDVDAALRLHVVDSLAWTHLVSPLEGPIVDIGSGAGFPGIPLAITQRHKVILCESVAKKAEFLRSANAALHLDMEIYMGRAEDLASEHPKLAGTVVARAVSSLPALIELASPLLRESGRLMALKGQPSSVELGHGDDAARICGMERTGLQEFVLPEGDEIRTLVEYTKYQQASVRLPRRPGQAQRAPLGRRK